MLCCFMSMFCPLAFRIKQFMKYGNDCNLVDLNHWILFFSSNPPLLRGLCGWTTYFISILNQGSVCCWIKSGCLNFVDICSFISKMFVNNYKHLEDFNFTNYWILHFYAITPFKCMLVGCMVSHLILYSNDYFWFWVSFEQHVLSSAYDYPTNTFLSLYFGWNNITKDHSRCYSLLVYLLFNCWSWTWLDLYDF